MTGVLSPLGAYLHPRLPPATSGEKFVPAGAFRSFAATPPYVLDVAGFTSVAGPSDQNSRSFVVKGAVKETLTVTFDGKSVTVAEEGDTPDGLRL